MQLSQHYYEIITTYFEVYVILLYSVQSLRSLFYILRIIPDQEDSQWSEVVQVFSYEHRIIVQKEFAKVSSIADAVLKILC